MPNGQEMKPMLNETGKFSPLYVIFTGKQKNHRLKKRIIKTFTFEMPLKYKYQWGLKNRKRVVKKVALILFTLDLDYASDNRKVN